VDGFFFWREFDAFDFLQLFDTALHLFRFGRLVAKAVDEDFELFDAVALILRGCGELFEALRLLVKILGIMPL